MNIEKGVSYYGNLFSDCLEKHLDELKQMGFNAILLAVSEYEALQWFDRLKEMICIMKDYGFNVYWDFWAWGGVFGGEAASKFLHDHINGRQVLNNGEVVPAICFENETFVDYLKNWIRDIAEETEITGFFWDEPSFYRLTEENIWACRCETCKTKYFQFFNEIYPLNLTEKVIQFRERQIITFLENLLDTVKEVNNQLKNIVCLLPEEDVRIGIIDKEKIAALKNLDILSTDPYWAIFDKDLRWYKEKTEEIVNLAKKYDLQNQIWLQLFLLPKEEIANLSKAVEIAIDLGVSSIFVWPFRAAEGLTISSERPKETWLEIGRIFKSI